MFQTELTMSVNQAGRNRPITKFNKRRRSWTTDGRHDPGNGPIFGWDLGRAGEPIVQPIEQPRKTRTVLDIE
jgi:hypothetical protein